MWWFICWPSATFLLFPFFLILFFIFVFFICFTRTENSTQFWHLYLFQRAPVSSPQCVLSYNQWTREGGQNETPPHKQTNKQTNTRTHTTADLDSPGKGLWMDGYGFECDVGCWDGCGCRCVFCCGWACSMSWNATGIRMYIIYKAKLIISHLVVVATIFSVVFGFV